tara:strand:+ start:433 stop:825 length:393 start_codon:yes stop_codon:yes gene_type:complete
MKSILYILSAIIFYCSTVYAGNFEQVCMDIGYDEDSEKFNTCVAKLSARDKPLNKDVELAGKADYSPLIETLIISSVATLAVDAMSGSNSQSNSNSNSNNTGAIGSAGGEEVNSSFVRLCIIDAINCNGF